MAQAGYLAALAFKVAWLFQLFGEVTQNLLFRIRRFCRATTVCKGSFTGVFI